MNPALPGVPQSTIVVLAEKNNAIHAEAFPFCFKKCVRSFTEEGFPYFPAEKTCMDRCQSKLTEAYHMALDQAEKVEADRKSGMVGLGDWVHVLDQVHKRH